MERRNPQSSTAKMLKLCSENNEDRISSLPDTIIHHILSSLSMRHAVQTSILSRRWRYIWTSIQTLNFTSNPRINTTTMETFDEPGFIQFVDQVLVLRDGSNIEKFHLEGDRDVKNRLHTWICYAVRRNVQQLSLTINLQGVPPLPHCLFTCKSLTSFIFKSDIGNHTELILPHSLDLPALRTLHLEFVKFDNESAANKLFSSCPDLESLVISDCEFSVMNLNIYYPKLKYLGFDNYCQGNSFNDPLRGKVEIYTPNLRQFSFGEFIDKEYFLKDLPNLVEADIFMAIPNEDDEPVIPPETKDLYAQRMLSFLRALHKVKDLTLYGVAVELISRASDLLHSTPLLFNNLIHLNLHSWLSRDCIHAITCLLKISPNIETLSLTMREHPCTESPTYPYVDEINFSSTNVGDYWEAGLSLECLLHYLKYVEVREIKGCVNELKFLEILLKNATTLKKMVAFTSVSNQSSRQRLIKFSEKLPEFPRASSSITISFFSL